MMTSKFSTYLLTGIVALCLIGDANAQDKDTDKEIIIIEKTIDKDGNVVSKNIKRNRGSYSEEELQKMIESEDDLPALRSFDLEGMGFGEDLGSLFAPRKKQKPSLGVMLEIQNDQLKVTSVVKGSGAEEADIRAGDKIISVDGLPVASVEDIKAIVEKQESGASIDMIIWRDGAELEKTVKLKANNFAGPFGDIEFDFPGGRGFKFFGDGDDMDLDSMLSQLGKRGFDLFENNGDMFDFDGFDMNQFKGLRERGAKENTSTNKSGDRPQLGLFIEDKATGIVVTEVIDGTPAAEAGIKEGDLITHIDENIIGSYRELSAWMNTKNVGDKAIITIKRNGKSKNLSLQL